MRGVLIIKVVLYDNEKLNLPPLKTFNERVKYIEDNVLNQNKYQKYYNICAIDLSPNEIKNIENWWLGVKKVNNPTPIENVKKHLDFLTKYILDSRDFSIKLCINKYNELKKKKNIRQLSKKEKQEYYDLKNKIIYETRDFVFFDNKEIENQLEYTLDLLNNTLYRNYTDDFMIKDIEKRLNMCQKIKENVENIKKNIIKLSNEKNEIESTIKKEFELFQVSKDENNLNSIVNLASKIKEINQEIFYCKIKIKEEYQDYLLCTEFFYKTK